MQPLDLAGMKPERVQFDRTTVYSAFNYSLAIEPESGTFVITVLPSLGSERLQLPFAALEFGVFLRQLTEAHERWMARNDNAETANENGAA